MFPACTFLRTGPGEQVEGYSWVLSFSTAALGCIRPPDVEASTRPVFCSVRRPSVCHRSVAGRGAEPVGFRQSFQTL
jgi:hypothetical protein